MHLPFKSRGRACALALASAAALAAGLSSAVPASAMRDGASTERHALRVQERAARRAQRRSEAQARRQAHAESRAARQLAREERDGQRESGEGSGTGEAAAPSSSGAVGDAAGCTVTLATPSRRVLAGESVSLSGSLTCPTPAATSSSLVNIYEHTAGSPRGLVALSRTLTPTEAGSFTMVAGPLQANTSFVARVGRAHARVAVKVAPKITLSAIPAAQPADTGVAASARPADTTFSGTVTPAAAGSRVIVQVSYAATGEHWRSIVATRTDAEGSYSVGHPLRLPGVTAVRTIVHCGAHLVLGVSEAVSLEASQPQNPKLTIAASSDPLIAGAKLVISGVAAGEGHEPVKLLARTSAGAWRIVAEGSTGGEGDYSFEQTPLASTRYRVTDATESSTTLHDVVAFAISPEVPPTSVVAGQAVSLGGTVSPAVAGQRVMLEQRGAAGDYHVIATGSVGPPPDYAVSATFATPGQYELRVRVPSDAAHRATTSAPFELTVAAPSS